eukprot:2445283-Alexandrium_andersonii.AAC.1
MVPLAVQCQVPRSLSLVHRSGMAGLRAESGLLNRGKQRRPQAQQCTCVGGGYDSCERAGGRPGGRAGVRACACP